MIENVQCLYEIEVGDSFQMSVNANKQRSREYWSSTNQGWSMVGQKTK